VFLTEKPWSYAVPLVRIALATLMFPLALVPFGVFLPARGRTHGAQHRPDAQGRVFICWLDMAWARCRSWRCFN
jgi:hypothetical protein